MALTTDTLTEEWQEVTFIAGFAYIQNQSKTKKGIVLIREMDTQTTPADAKGIEYTFEKIAKVMDTGKYLYTRAKAGTCEVALW